MILSDSRILEEIEKNTIKIEPYKRDCLGSNSYDVHLGKVLATYREHLLFPPWRGCQYPAARWKTFLQGKVHGHEFQCTPR